jgi:transcriptional regulator with PAS, ATPase and Fis domain
MSTLPIGREPGAPQVRRFRLTVVEGPAAGRSLESSSDRQTVGSAEPCELRVDDPTVSRFHCEISILPDGAHVRDLDSKNGTIVDGVQVRDAYLRSGSLVRLGRTVVRFDYAAESNRIPMSAATRFGSLVGESVAMRSTFALLERAAQSDATVLLEGETGTGKGQAARSLHGASARAAGPFVVIDCAAMPANLLESELFGHERGAFTGAVARRTGAFEEAHGGTIFLDELGELPADLQPKLLRVLEEREIRRVGGTAVQAVDVRVIAATNRDLRAEVNLGRFRADLYFRLAVLRITLPSLRARPEDLPALATALLETLGASAHDRARVLSPERLQRMQGSAWPGNVRELRNVLERALVFDDDPASGEGPASVPVPPSPSAPPTIDASLSYLEAKRRATEDFERRYVQALLERHDGKVTAAASAAGIDKAHLYKLLRRHRDEP